MNDGTNCSAGVAQTLAAIRDLVAADDPRQAASAAIDWLRAVADVEAAGVVLAAGTRITHREFSGDESLRDTLLEELAAFAISESRQPGNEVVRHSDDENASPHGMEFYPLRAGEHQQAAFGLVPRKDGSGRHQREESLPELLEILSTKLDSIDQVARLRMELAQTKRWFNTLDSQLRVLDRERQKLSAVVSQSDTLMVTVDSDRVVRWANAAMAARLREAADRNPIGTELETVWDAIGAHLPEPGSPDCPAARTFRTGSAVHAESTAPAAGQVHNLYLTFLPIRTPRGETTELLVMIQDLSDLEVLRRSETRYRLLFERSPDAMLMVEPDTGHIALANDVAALLTGYPLDELRGLSVQRLHEPEDWSRAEADYAAVMKTDRALFAERRLRTRSGDQLSAEVTAMRFDLDGRPVIFIEFRDVTERKRLEEQLRHSQKMEAVGQLAGGVAHDFNNILTVLMGEAELLAGTPEASELVRETAQVIGRETRRASLLTRKLLTISRKEVRTTEVLDLNDVLRGVEGLLRPLIGETVGLHLQLCSQPCPVRADRAQLEQIVTNLAVNARDAMPTGGVLRIEVERGEYSGPTDDTPRDPTLQEARLTVRDDGTGMDAPTSQRLFEPFFTTKPPGEGTGLGLTTVHRIVREHEGSIEVESEPGQGTRFRIRLPIAAGDIVTPRVSEFPEQAPTHTRLLLVEDRPELLKLSARVLRQAGYDVISAESGETALAIIRSSDTPFDVLVTDVVLPHMSGGELAEEATEAMPDLQVLYVSGYAEDHIVRHGVSTSQAAFLAKPFSPKTLLATVQKLLETR